jgi:hypothetical protein
VVVPSCPGMDSRRGHPSSALTTGTSRTAGIGLCVFSHQTVPEGEPPRSHVERVYNIHRWTVFPLGGHFAPVEEAAAVAGELTAFFHASR